MTTTVRNQLTDAASAPVPGWVTIRLTGLGLRPTTQSEALSSFRVPTDDQGNWTVDLEENTPESPYYVVTEQAIGGDIKQHVISVPLSASPLWLGDVIVAVPLPVTRSESVFMGPPGPPGTGGGGGGAISADADADTKGVLKLAGDLAGTADAPLVPGKEDTGVAADEASAALQAAIEYIDDQIAAMNAARVYAQVKWNPVTSTWPARPPVPAGTVVTWYSWESIDAVPPPGGQAGDKWDAHPQSSYRAA